MQCGIYLLKFSNSGFYIGQSVNISRRFREHCISLIKGNHKNYKVQNAYIETKSLPILEILCECKKSELDRYETEAFEIFDPCVKGLNIALPAGEFPTMLGETNGFSKYSDKNIVELVRFLLRYPDKSLKTLADEYGIHYSTVKNIANGTSHTWLLDKIPEEYAKLISMKGTRAINTCGSSGKLYTIISPEGIIYNIDNITLFAQQHNLNRGALGQVLNGKYKQHKGWKSATTY